MTSNTTTWTPLCVEGAYMGTDARFGDHRGYFQELFHKDKYPAQVHPANGTPQVSLSHSHRGVLRGIHCSAYAKLITIVKGAIYDVIVDLRKDSPTFRRWCAVVVSSENRRQLHIPAGCGHGFVCLEDADMLYLQSGCMDPLTEMDLDPFDPTLGVHWPKLDDFPEYTMSDKDRKAPAFLEREQFKGTISDEAAAAGPLKRVLVIGASGQVGGALVEAYGAENVIGTYSKVPCDGMVQFDLEAAATDPALAADLMTIAARRSCASACGARTVYYSTDYVFEGDTPGRIYAESDPVGPVNVYGSSKLAGEAAVLAEDPASLVLRTTGVFGPEKQGKNFGYQLLNAVADKRSMACATDSFGSPTYNRDLAAMTVGLLEANATGVYHCVGPETMHRHAFATLIAETLGLDAALITSVDSDT
eukprot:CAMPEP_0197618592 /NCGR_PEP_ID=MMETSP1326-20131121/61614_1 /TAXON_ID=1155430 /ORGANISM="Genus nov. species nov., Strain RCC2288" /LENGTH=417 /DNA_ID=CAMNT_0043187491 /DNA_START=4 /DNA_END=1255 /DNA_ORIENTATION=+